MIFRIMHKDDSLKSRCLKAALKLPVSHIRFLSGCRLNQYQCLKWLVFCGYNHKLSVSNLSRIIEINRHRAQVVIFLDLRQSSCSSIRVLQVVKSDSEEAIRVKDQSRTKRCRSYW